MPLNIDIGKEIRKELKSQKRSIRWLAGKIGCDQSNLTKKLQLTHMNSELITKISDALDVRLYQNLSDAYDDGKQVKTNSLKK